MNIKLFFLEIPVITSPEEEVITLTNLDGLPLTYECTATGLPTPEVYWNSSTDTASPTLVITSILLPDKTNVFECTAINDAGEDTVTITIHVDVPAVDVIGGITDDLDNEVTISPEVAEMYVGAINNALDVAIDTNGVNDEILMTVTTAIESVLNKTNGTISNETAVAITNTLNSVIDSTADMEPPVTVSLTIIIQF